MKRIIKTISVLLAVLSLCVLFTGCDYIDELRAKHAIISEDKQAVAYKGKTFYRLPEGIPYFFNDTASNSVNITDYDVPVLLSEDFCHTGYYDPLSDIIAVSWVDENEVTTYNSTGYTYFTQKDNYEKYLNLKTDNADRVAFYDYNNDYGICLLSSDASEEILRLSNSPEEFTTETPENVTSIIFPLFSCNKELTLRGNLDGYEIYIIKDKAVYLYNYNTCENVRLSDKTSEEIIEKQP